MISYNTNRYHVPPEAIGKKVLLKIKDGTIDIFDDDRLLISHNESKEKHQWITDPAIIEQILALRHDRLAQKRYGRSKGKATRGLVNASLFAQVSAPSFIGVGPLCSRRCRMDQLVTDRLRENL